VQDGGLVDEAGDPVELDQLLRFFLELLDRQVDALVSVEEEGGLEVLAVQAEFAGGGDHLQQDVAAGQIGPAPQQDFALEQAFLALQQRVDVLGTVVAEAFVVEHHVLQQSLEAGFGDTKGVVGFASVEFLRKEGLVFVLIPCNQIEELSDLLIFKGRGLQKVSNLPYFVILEFFEDIVYQFHAIGKS
jgi:hypothetical protein